MQDDITGPIGRTLDGLLRPHTAQPADGVLRVADLHAGELADAAKQAGLQIVFTYPEDREILEISDHNNVPAFDLLVGDLPKGEQREMFYLALRFLRIRRPAAFVLTHTPGRETEAVFWGRVQNQTRQLGYRVYRRGAFIVGVDWTEPFTFPSTLTAQTVIAHVAGSARAHADA